MTEPAFDEVRIGNGEPSVPEDTAALRKSSRVIHPPRRYDLLITNDALLVEEDEPTTYAESKSNVDSKRWFQANPGKKHWIAVKNILKYLRRTKDMFLVYGGNELRVQVGKVPKQERTADSTTEAEYIAASEAEKEAVWIKKFISELGVVPSIVDPISLYCDNNGAIAQAKEPRSH
ncbi:Uncharacterized protein Adt_31467 [Abeliophyllum distichum]|uniref:Retrotransposon protein, putative, Ty1-copia subclass n=1 Tax=Abeliophyllum distichum TaxID=126358 RepID=A0ABD1RE56_9LAMI